MSVKTKVRTSCMMCGKEVEKKVSQMKRHKNHYCSHECKHKGKVRDVDLVKGKIMFLYENGVPVTKIAREFSFKTERLYYHLQKWGLVEGRRKHRKKIRTQKDANFLQRHKNGEISWRRAHSLASRLWGITDKPCKVCGWKEAERDMHLIVPRLLEKENAVSLCPNHHRLFHRGKLKLL